MFNKLANGFLCFGPATFVSCAFILSQFAQKGCQFITLADEDTSNSFGNSRDPIMKSAGLSCWRSTGGNDYIYDDEFTYSDEHATTTKLALATTVMGATAFGVYFLASCIKFPNFLWLVISLILVATCVCEGMILGTFTDTDWCDETNNCELGKSAKCGIAACVFWGLSAFMTCGVFAEANRDDELD